MLEGAHVLVVALIDVASMTVGLAVEPLAVIG
jgi:hypothetical protein